MVLNQLNCFTFTQEEQTFAAFMAEKMKNEDWLQFLKDLDNLEANCKIGYMGAYHVNIPHIANLTEEGAAEFYLKKEQLYQSTVYHLTGIQNYLFFEKLSLKKDH